MLLEQLKSANIAALKAHDTNARAIYSVVINKITQKEIELRTTSLVLTDADVVAIIQKTLKELAEEASGFLAVNNLVRHQAILAQASLLEGYLPTMLTEAEIVAEIATLTDKSVPAIMQHFKKHFAGRVDMGLVNRLARIKP